MMYRNQWWGKQKQNSFKSTSIENAKIPKKLHFKLEIISQSCTLQFN